MSAISSLRRPGAYFALCLVLVCLFCSTSRAHALANCGTATNPSIPAGPTGCDVQFGSIRQYDTGVHTSVAINTTGLVVEFHESQANSSIWYRLGTISGMNVLWGNSQKVNTFYGYWPSVAVNKDGVVLVVYSDNKYRSGSNLNYQVGKVDPNGGGNQSIDWRTPDKRWDAGFHSGISMNDAGVILGVHEGSGREGELYYRIGHFKNPGSGDYDVEWDSKNNGIYYTGGQNPHISINNKNQIVEMHQVPNENKLHYIRGTLSADKSRINFGDQPRLNSYGGQGAVALTDNGYVIEVHKETATGLGRMMGKLNATNPNLIDWGAIGGRGYMSYIEDLSYPAVATNGTYAIETAQDLDGSKLRYSTSLLNDRSNWIGDMLPSLGNKTLSDIVIPGSHDAGMYCGIDSIGKTQNQNIYAQLQGGVRYFDLRVMSGDPLRIYHGSASVSCDPVGVVFDDVAKFMKEGHKEVVVLKLSHFLNFGNCTTTGEYIRLKNSITTRLSPWMYTANTHPAEVPISQILENGGGKVVVVVDGDWAAPQCNQQQAGFYIYKDWCSGASYCDSTGNPAQGEFTVFDRYSNTTDYNKMKEGQLQMYGVFKGTMGYDESVPCDLFLLSWTLTPLGAINVEGVSQPAAENLGEVMNSVNRNPNGFIPNIVYVDFYEETRVTDTTLLLNQRFNQ